MLTKFCKNKHTQKALAIVLIITMTFANLLLLGKNLISYALDNNLETQGVDTQHSNVKFDAYFTGDGGKNIHSVIFDATNNTAKMNLYIAVKNMGYLKEAYIDFRDELNGINTNYEISSDAENTTLIQSVNSNLNTASLNYIEAGTEAVIEVPIKLKLTDLTELSKLQKNSLVTLRGIYVDGNGNEIEISKTIKLNIGWTLETDIQLEQQVTKYVPYSINNQKGLILQLELSLKQTRNDLALPVVTSNLNVNVPKISNTLPKEITVTADSTMATNGDKIEFTNNNWEYNKEEEKITIEPQSYDKDGVVWSGVGVDKYYITYIYPEEVYEDAFNPYTEHIFLADATMSLYSAGQLINKTATSTLKGALIEKVGDIVIYDIDVCKKEISKGKMYANYNSQIKTYDTEYGETIKANVSNHEIIDGIYMALPADNFTAGEDTYTINNTYFKQITINKAKLQKLLGEDGSISISDGTSTYIINKETEDKEGTYTIDFEEDSRELSIQTSKPLSDGILEIDAKKIISKDLEYTKEQVKIVEKIKLNLQGATMVNGSYQTTQSAEDTVFLTETSTNVKLEINNKTLSSMVENKNVEMKITLNNNVETSDLYKNAVFAIRLPKYIENIEVTGGNILYSNGLEIDYIEPSKTENGIVLIIHTKGEETCFSDGVLTNGTNIVLNTNIKVNELTPNISDTITLEYTNESAISYINGENGHGLDSVEVSFVAPEEMVTFNTIAVNELELTSTNGNIQTAKLDILGSSKTATIKMSIRNLYSNKVNNIRLLGRLPFAGNKDISNGADLDSTFSTQLASTINTNGINAVVYYSSNEFATENLYDETNAWTTDISSLQSVKSYLIVLLDYEMQVGETLNFSYDIIIPANLEHNQNAFATYAVYFDNISNYTAKSTANATKVGLTTGIGPNLQMNTVAIYDNKEISSQDFVKEFSTLTYKTTVSNNSYIDAQNVQLKSNITNGLILNAVGSPINDSNVTLNLPSIPAGESATIQYDVSVDEISLDSDILTNDISLTAQNFDGQLDDSINANIENSELQVEFSIKDIADLEQPNNSEIYFDIKIKNSSGQAINNILVTENVPEGLEFIEGGTPDIKYDKNSRTISINIDTLNDDETIYKTMYFRTKLPSGVGKIEAKSTVNVTGDGINTYSDEIIVKIKGAVLNLDLTSSLTSGTHIKEGNKIELTVLTQNLGEITANGASIQISLPEELRVDSAYYEKENKRTELTKDTQNTFRGLMDIDKGETITLKIFATADMEGKSDSEIEASINATASAYKVDKVTSNTLTYTIEKVNNPIIDNPDNPTPSVPTYTITGVAWLDENKDGKKDNNEKLLEGINAMLINAKTGVIVIDLYNGLPKETKTSANGEYSFSGIPVGEYMVIFEYNTGLYDATEYNKTGVDESLSSKAIQSQINKDGKLKTAGITNKLTITDSSIANINIGLIEKPKFDLSLQKQLTTVTIQNNSGSKTYNFDNTKLGKVDIPAKDLNSSIATIQYKITVKNEGAIAGYAKKIIDYKSSDLEFNENNNLGWYIGVDGNLYNDSLANTIINPGEAKELTLTLTKKMTEENTGIVSNKAEIYEDYNEFGYTDYNSKPANNAQDENDLDYVNLIITVKTGEVVLYITIILISIAIIANGAYVINKKVLKGGRQ